MAEEGNESGKETERSFDRKKKGHVAKLFFKVGERIGVVEQTRLAPEFVADIEKYYKYQEDVDNLVDSLEGVLQNNEAILRRGNIECERNDDPYEEFARNIKAFRPFLQPDIQESTVTAEAVIKRMAIMHRDMQTKAIRKMRRFVTKDRMNMIDMQKKLMQARDTMDAARHELKKTRTTDMVEVKGKYYERMVHEFDQQAAKVAAFPEHLPTYKEEHQKELFAYFEVVGNFHQNAAVMLAEQLSKLGVRSPSSVVDR